MRVQSLTAAYATILAWGLMPLTAHGQFSDGEFLQANYNTSGVGLQDYRFNVDYSNIDVFNDGFLVINIPEAPNSSGGSATTGVFLSANNDSLSGQAGVEAFASIIPTAANVGAGTATPNFVMQVDVFHNSGMGVDDGAGNVDLTGTTNYSYVGINQTNTTVRIQENNNTATSGQGIGLAITADRGGAEDYLPHYGGVGYRDRVGLGANTTGTVTDFRSGGADNPALSTGLAGKYINDYWITQGFELEPATGDGTELNQFTGDAGYFSPDLTNPGGFVADGSGVDRSFFEENLPEHSDPLVVTADLTAPAFQVGNDTNGNGVPYNQWAVHRVYWIDGVVTYTVSSDSTGNTEVPLMQLEINDPTQAGDDTVFDPVSMAGSVVLGFWDRFGGSIALSPEGANFVVYDNLQITAATAGDAPDMLDFLGAQGFIPSTGVPGDFDGDDDVDGADFLLWQRDTAVGSLADWQSNFGFGAPAGPAVSGVPEPATAGLLAIAAALVAMSRRRANA